MQYLSQPILVSAKHDRLEAMERLLVVDDYQISRDALVELLSDAGYACMAAADGGQAIDLLRTRSVDLILLDINMPKVNGLQVLEEIRRQRSAVELPVIMVTAYSGSDAVVNALTSGANDYVTKPIDLAALLARVRTQLQIRELARLKDEFLSIASHDLKNPLTVMLGAAEALAEEFPPGTTMTVEGCQLIELAIRRTRHMIRIVTDFLDMQAAEQGHMKLRKTQIELHRIAARVLDDNRIYATSKEIALRLVPSELIRVCADEARITQVIENLVSNAIKFGSPGAKVEIAIRAGESMVTLEVRDTGPGISPADMEKLFVKHARLGNHPTGGESSSGLGLAFCKQVVELHGGRIGVRNREQSGAVFWFELPREAK